MGRMVQSLSRIVKNGGRLKTVVIDMMYPEFNIDICITLHNNFEFDQVSEK